MAKPKTKPKSLTVSDICGIMERLAPLNGTQKWDNTGLLIGRPDMPTNKVLVALDVTDAVIIEAAEIGVQMIISHHPIIFPHISSITSGDRQGAAVLEIIENKIAVYAAHTNLDATQGGTSDALAEGLGLSDIKSFLIEGGDKPLSGRKGDIKTPMKLSEYACFVKNVLGLKTVRYAGDGEITVKKAAVCAGSGADTEYLIKAKEAGCDVYITGDVTYHKAQYAVDIGLPVIDATHFASEIPVVEYIRRFITEEALKLSACVDVFASKKQKDIFNEI